METRLTLRPGMPGTKKLVARFGERLVCVRYLYDPQTRRRLKTVELVVEAVEWEPRQRRPRRRGHDLVGVQVGYDERELRAAVKTAGGIWRPRQRLWELSWDAVRVLGLEARVADLVTRRLAHGYSWAPQFSMTPEQEKAEYEANIKAIKDATGTRPVGFNAFWMRGTPKTLEILQDLGFTYHIDDLSRDEPFTVQVKGKPFVVVPYSVEHNDIVLFEARHFSAAAFAQELKDAFDVLYEEAGRRRRLMSISAHDRIAGHPARVKAFADFIDYAQIQKGVWFARKDEIAKWTLESKDTIRES